ncbi:MAG TPA: DUF2283 domain-containing protein [bacterium]
MKFKVDKENDPLHFRLNESMIVESEEFQPGIILDFDKGNQVVGIEFLSISTHTEKEGLHTT